MRKITASVLTVWQITFMVAVARSRVVKSQWHAQTLIYRLQSVVGDMPVVLVCHDAYGRPSLWRGDVTLVVAAKNVPLHTYEWQELTLVSERNHTPDLAIEG